MSYDPQSYWEAAGRDRENTEHETHFRRTQVFATQEERLMALLRTLEFRSILEVGCGWGRITKLVHDEWPDVRYLAIDISPERLSSARLKAPGVVFANVAIQKVVDVDPKYDLVLAVETLMHVRPEEIGDVVAKLLALSSKYVVSLDWNAPIAGPIAPWNFRHPYAALYGSHLRSVEQVGLQAIHLAEAK